MKVLVTWDGTVSPTFSIQYCLLSLLKIKMRIISDLRYHQITMNFLICKSIKIFLTSRIKLSSQQREAAYLMTHITFPYLIYKKLYLCFLLMIHEQEDQLNVSMAVIYILKWSSHISSKSTLLALSLLTLSSPCCSLISKLMSHHIKLCFHVKFIMIQSTLLFIRICLFTRDIILRDRAK